MRRRFDHLVVELSVAVGRVVPRYALWLRLQELGWDPDHLPVEAVTAFCDDHAGDFLADHAMQLDTRTLRRLRRRLVRFDPRFPTPEETLGRIFSSPR
jgi:hypothetical protein